MPPAIDLRTFARRNDSAPRQAGCGAGWHPAADWQSANSRAWTRTAAVTNRRAGYSRPHIRKATALSCREPVLVASIRRRDLVDVVDHKDLDRKFFHFQLEAELVLQ